MMDKRSGWVGLVGGRKGVDEWLVGQGIVGVVRFQKMYGFYSFKHHIVKKS